MRCEKGEEWVRQKADSNSGQKVIAMRFTIYTTEAAV